MDRYSFVVRLLHSLHLAAFTGAPPELNPTEQVFGNLKSNELANLCSDTIDKVATEAEAGLCRIGSEPELCIAFLRHAGLRL